MGGPYGRVITGGGAGSSSPQWTLLTNLHSATVTPNGTAAVTSDFTLDTNTGLFDVTFASTTNESDGYNEQDRIRVPLVSLLGDWDPVTEGLAVYVETTADVSWSNRPIICVGLVSGGTASTALGAAFGVVGIGVSGQIYAIGQTSENGAITAAFTGVRPLFYALFDTSGPGSRPMATAMAWNGSAWTAPLAQTGDTPSASQPWYLHIGVGKNTTATDASGDTLQFRIYYARYLLPQNPVA